MMKKSTKSMESKLSLQRKISKNKFNIVLNPLIINKEKVIPDKNSAIDVITKELEKENSCKESNETNNETPLSNINNREISSVNKLKTNNCSLKKSNNLVLALEASLTTNTQAVSVDQVELNLKRHYPNGISLTPLDEIRLLPKDAQLEATIEYFNHMSKLNSLWHRESLSNKEFEDWIWIQAPGLSPLMPGEKKSRKSIKKTNINEDSNFQIMRNNELESIAIQLDSVEPLKFSQNQLGESPKEIEVDLSKMPKRESKIITNEIDLDCTDSNRDLDTESHDTIHKVLPLNSKTINRKSKSPVIVTKITSKEHKNTSKSSDPARLINRLNYNIYKKACNSKTDTLKIVQYPCTNEQNLYSTKDENRSMDLTDIYDIDINDFEDDESAMPRKRKLLNVNSKCHFMSDTSDEEYYLKSKKGTSNSKRKGRSQKIMKKTKKTVKSNANQTNLSSFINSVPIPHSNSEGLKKNECIICLKQISAVDYEDHVTMCVNLNGNV